VKPCLTVVQHHAAEGPGGVATWAARRGIVLDLVRADLRELPVRLDTPLLLLGGPVPVPNGPGWLQQERRWLRDDLRHGRPCFGICLGAQLIADALGGQVAVLPAAEAGWCEVSWPCGHRQAFLQWHDDGIVKLPPKARVLASSPACPVQMFQTDARVVGVQFHPEWDRPSVRALQAHFGPACALRPEHLDAEAGFTEAQRWLDQALDRWWTAATG